MESFSGCNDLSRLLHSEFVRTPRQLFRFGRSSWIGGQCPCESGAGCVGGTDLSFILHQCMLYGGYACVEPSSVASVHIWTRSVDGVVCDAPWSVPTRAQPPG